VDFLLIGIGLLGAVTAAIASWFVASAAEERSTRQR
jgi:hypothetical protein